MNQITIDRFVIVEIKVSHSTSQGWSVRDRGVRGKFVQNPICVASVMTEEMALAIKAMLDGNPRINTGGEE